MPKIHALIFSFNSADVILECLESIDGKVDDIWVFDGRWKGFDYPSQYSNDGTDKIVLKFARTAKSKVHLGFIPANSHQYEARTIAINVIPEDDWILFVDSDECIKKWTLNKEMLETERGFRICYKYDRIYAAHPSVRLFKKTRGMKFSFNHRILEDDNGLVDPILFKVTTDIVFEHQELADKKKMREAMIKYKDWLFNWENERKV